MVHALISNEANALRRDVDAYGLHSRQLLPAGAAAKRPMAGNVYAIRVVMEMEFVSSVTQNPNKIQVCRFRSSNCDSQITHGTISS